ncbi:glycoside hydrolase family 19 protein [Paraburkholderia sp. C35]|uniref:glycoside hydrolase family 19 protein n=1 Tax=Paraburkholderia sp. C35 TaxID=2126993 RepID=UPI000D68E7B0|nr:glycoside hydrolase family 19 protein [Paraburkholderia sp. C35]
MQVTLAELKRLAPGSTADLPVWVDALNAAMAEFAITTEQRIEMFIAQCMHESASLSRMSENLNYSAQGLANTWDRYSVTGKRGGAPNALAQTLARRPVAIGNYVYANRLGNGSESSGEGFLYRGRCPLQLTGKANYIAAKTALNIDVVAHPELFEQPVHGARGAAWFWKAHGLNEIADTGNFKATTAVINGGDIGGAARIGLWQLAKEVIA